MPYNLSLENQRTELYHDTKRDGCYYTHALSNHVCSRNASDSHTYLATYNHHASREVYRHCVRSMQTPYVYQDSFKDKVHRLLCVLGKHCHAIHKHSILCLAHPWYDRGSYMQSICQAIVYCVHSSSRWCISHKT